jgi:hypothetical protein
VILRTATVERPPRRNGMLPAVPRMFNRYVDGLGTTAPADERTYAAMAPRLLDVGYAVPATFDRQSR